MCHRGGGGQTFSRGVKLFPGGVQLLIYIETLRTCDFRGGLDPLSPSGSEHDVFI